MIDKCTDKLNALVIRVYYPSNHNFNTCKLPAAIVFHAGSYAECSSYTNPGVRALCRKLCARGMVVYDVNYRVGVIADTRIVTSGPMLIMLIKHTITLQGVLLLSFKQ